MPNKIISSLLTLLLIYISCCFVTEFLHENTHAFSQTFSECVLNLQQTSNTHIILLLYIITNSCKACEVGFNVSFHCSHTTSCTCTSTSIHQIHPSIMMCTPLRANGSSQQNVTHGNITQALYSFTDSATDDLAIYDNVEYVLYHYVLPMICCFGVLGNILNLIILSRKSLTVHMERLEKYVHSHLIALAASDLMYCITIMPHAFNPKVFSHPSARSPWLLYDIYNIAVINTFLLFSCWLTVAIAVLRYITICHPMRARQYVSLMATRKDIGVIFILSVLFNVPRYFTHTIYEVECMEGGYVYYANPNGALSKNPQQSIYGWMYFVVGIVLPLIALAYCNIFFIRALQTSQNQQRQHSSQRHGSSSTSASNHSRILTLTLSSIVVLYVLLVVPAETLTFFQDYVREHYKNNGDRTVYARFALTVAICNTLQTFNFAVNFLLYCMFNVNFRRVIMRACHCQSESPRPRQSSSERRSMLSNETATDIL